ncbi:MAG: DNA mismatch repair protein MutS2, partial [Myxococcota bacterium]
EDPRFQNAAVWLDPQAKVPTYQLRRGVSGASSALDMARRLGLDGGIVDRAKAVLGDRGLSFERALERLDETREELDQEREAVVVQRDKLTRQIDALKRQEDEVSETADRVIEERRAEVLKELADAKRTIRDVVTSLQREPTSRNAQRRRVKLAEVEKAVSTVPVTRETAVAPTEPNRLKPADVKVGSLVFVPAFKRDGTIEEIRGTNAVVAVGGLRTTVSIASLQPPPERERVARPKPSQYSIRETVAPPRAGDNTVDVRGKRIDEAMSEVERALDNAILQNRSAIFVLHGHGTGRLKTGLREHLRRSHYVDRFEAAHADQGGDAVTLVWLE